MKTWHVILFILMFTLVGCGSKGDTGQQGSVGPAGQTGQTGATGPSGPARRSITLIVPDDYTDIQSAINALPSNGGSVFIRAGIYVLTREIHVNRSNVSLSGEPGTVLRLAPGVNKPVILLGTDVETPTQTMQNLQVENLEIDGNMGAQTSETDPSRPWIRNNGIDVRKVKGLWIKDVNVHDSRSGGLVVSWASSDIFVSDSIFASNFFDGIALYDSRAISISNFQSKNNKAAGLSLDNKLSDVQFSTGRIESNVDVGIFVRDSSDLAFYDLVITKNGSHGAFLSHQSLGTGTGVKRFFFEGCSFLDNKGFGFWLASPASDSSNNVVANSLFSGNTSGAIQLDSGAVLTQAGNVVQ